MQIVTEQLQFVKHRKGSGGAELVVGRVFRNIDNGCIGITTHQV